MRSSQQQLQFPMILAMLRSVITRSLFVTGVSALALLSGSGSVLWGQSAPEAIAKPDATKVITRVAIGSCAKQDRPQPIWDSIVQYDPELFIMIGDNIYGDTEDMEVLRAKYDLLGSMPGFKKLRSKTPLIATWDDHDYGVNDGGVEYAKKVESQKVFVDFFQVPTQSRVRREAGVYDSYLFGPPGKRLQVILLDTRYFRSPLKQTKEKQPKGIGPYVPDESPDSTMLGESQWKWFEEQLKVDADFRIIASSIQFVPYENRWELWNNFPLERKRLLDLLAKHHVTNAMLISGDRHLAELSRIPAAESPTQSDIYDLTSSSLNQPSGNSPDEPNKYRIGANFLKINFGTIEIDWEKDPLEVRLSIRDDKGEVQIDHKIDVR